MIALRLTLAALLATTAAQARDPSDCTGLVPAALPPSFDLHLGDSTQNVCGTPAVDGSGALFINRITPGGNGAGDQLYFSASGAQVATTTLAGVTSVEEQDSGFLVYTSESSPDYQHYLNLVRGLSAEGLVLGTSTVFDGLYSYYEQHLFVPDPRGGAAIVDTVLTGGTDDKSPWEVRARRVSTTGANTLGPTLLASGPRLVPRVWPLISAAGNLLLFAGGEHFPGLRNNQLVSRWFDPADAALTPWFVAFDQVDAGLDPQPDVAGALPDGSVAALRLLRGAELRPGTSSVGTPPDWLPADQPSLVVLPDRIVVLHQHDTPCSTELEIRAPAGNRCGSISVPAGTLRSLCLNDLRLHVGRDGTLTRSAPGTDQNDCTYRVWPHALAVTR